MYSTNESFRYATEGNYCSQENFEKTYAFTINFKENEKEAGERGFAFSLFEGGDPFSETKAGTSSAGEENCYQWNYSPNARHVYLSTNEERRPKEENIDYQASKGRSIASHRDSF